ncbi:MAG: hypothetical protein HQL54_14260 [Magnetococcales bacterium]|nr:hypothetical protein [Magnetococcales bacterium]
MIPPSLQDRLLDLPDPSAPPTGLDALAHRLIGIWKTQPGRFNALQQSTFQVEDALKPIHHLSEHQLTNKRQHVHALIRQGQSDKPEVRHEAIALLCETAHRTLGLSPYPVQIMGALALSQGFLVEMATGEGKSLTAALAAALAGWIGRPCHLLTVNDYLAERDADYFSPFYQACGLRSGSVGGEHQPNQRGERYQREIVYTTAKELLGDFLRDRIALGRVSQPEQLRLRRIIGADHQSRSTVLRGLHTAIVDEADSLLIDEAVTPLIIAQPAENALLKETIITAVEMTEQFEPGVHFRINTRFRDLRLTGPGEQLLNTLTSEKKGVWQNSAWRGHIIRTALMARTFFKNGDHYVIDEGKVVLVDEFTGRQTPNRNLGTGLHQAVEALEGVEITDPTETIARLSFQKFFRLFRRLSGLTGTASEAVSEFWRIYEMPISVIPAHRPVQRRIKPARVVADADKKWQLTAQLAAKKHQTGQPILIGTRTVTDSQKLAQALKQKGLSFELLNAINHKEEAEIISKAGQHGKITIATNMAGRGTDIKLGPGIADLGGLRVIGTEMHESGRVDRQLFGRCSRQGDPGVVQLVLSMDDVLIQRFLHPLMKQALSLIVKAGIPGSRHMTLLAFRLAQKQAERMAFQRRAQVLKADKQLEESLSFGR